MGSRGLVTPAAQPYDNTSTQDINAELRRHLRQPPNLHTILRTTQLAHIQDAGTFMELLNHFEGFNARAGVNNANTPHQAYHSVFLDEPNQQLIGTI